MIDTTSNRQPQTWSENVLIPLVQNVIGGMAVSALAAVATSLMLNSSADVVRNAAIVFGTFTTCGFTAIRFFGDDLGILKSAFVAGQQSQQAEINRLRNQLHDAENLIEKYNADPQIDIGSTRNNQQILDAVADAEKLIQWGFDGQPISRAACGRRGIKQRAWERANKVLVNAGIVRDGYWVHDNQKAARRALQAHFNKRSAQSISPNIVTPY